MNKHKVTKLAKPSTPILSLPKSFTKAHSTKFNNAISFILSKDPSLYSVIIQGKFKDPFSSVPINSLQLLFKSLTKSIISQQIHGKAALSIETRFIQLFSDLQEDFPSYQDVINTSNDDLYQVGLSKRKTEYIKSLATSITNGVITKDIFNKSNEEIIQSLIQIKGIGIWTSQMFLSFGLLKMDILSLSDLGIKRGFAQYVSTRPELLTPFTIKPNKNNKNKKTNWIIYDDTIIETISEQFKPFRTIWMLILWRLSGTDVQVLQTTRD